MPAFPLLDFDDPTYLTFMPGTDRLVVCGRQGQVHVFEDNPQCSEKILLLDLTGTTQGWHDCGLLAVAFHPQFGQRQSPNRGYFYVWRQYTTNPTSGPDPPEWVAEGRYNRLSRFTIPDGQLRADPKTELVLVDQYDRHIFHNGGALMFGPEGFLYFTNGDEGGMYDKEFHAAQKLNGGLFSGVFRIDVDRDPARSHPIRRHPTSPDPRYPCFTGNYFIPNDNPFVSPNGDTLEEYWAFGLRNPDVISRDPVTGEVWVSDVGQQLREELNLLKKGGNYEWSFREGIIAGPKPRPAEVLGEEIAPVYDYRHRDGNNSVVGGHVYRGKRHADQLTGKYLFGDNGSGRIWALSREENQPPRVELLTRMPPGKGWSGFSRFGIDRHGELYLCKMGHPGRIYRLDYEPRRRDTEISAAPRLLSETGVFADLETLSASPGLLQYSVNAPFWSDGATKQRWMALPAPQPVRSEAEPPKGDGITFSVHEPWQFPVGTVFVKHFEMPIDETRPVLTKRLETRLLVHGEDGIYYGLTYKWRDDGSDAVRVDQALEEQITVQTMQGVRQRRWFFPSSRDCLTCHTASARYVLGVNTAQLNGPPGDGGATRQVNQLARWNGWGLFREPMTAEPKTLPRAVPLDDERATLADRVRSYLDVNCAMCHRPGVVRSHFDARFQFPLDEKRLIDARPTSPATMPTSRLVVAGAPDASVLIDRMTRRDHLRMPPLANRLVHAEAVELVRAWISSLAEREHK